MSPITPTTQYRKMVYLDPDTLAHWEAYKALHPHESFTGLVNRLLKVALGVPEIVQK
jgi:hypothetical protein